MHPIFGVCLLLWHWHWWHLSYVLALVNVTIDDTDGDPTTNASILYSPPTAWNFGPNCTFCSAIPNASLAYDHTWHDGTYNPNDGIVFSAQVSFTGTAVYVYNILAYGITGAATDLTFLIDGVQLGNYSQTTINGTGFIYNNLVFSAHSLPSTSHNLTILNGANHRSNTSLLLLDYVVYSSETGTETPTPTPTPTPSSNPSSQHTKTSTPVIVGSVVGSVSAVVIASVIAFCLRRSRRQKTKPGAAVVPYLGATSPPEVRVEKVPPNVQPTSANANENEEGSTQTQMVPVGTALGLAAEVNRLREEINRLQGREESEDVVPPPYDSPANPSLSAEIARV